jgi:hypothetical protein
VRREHRSLASIEATDWRNIDIWLRLHVKPRLNQSASKLQGNVDLKDRRERHDFSYSVQAYNGGRPVSFVRHIIIPLIDDIRAEEGCTILTACSRAKVEQGLQALAFISKEALAQTYYRAKRMTHIEVTTNIFMQYLLEEEYTLAALCFRYLTRDDQLHCAEQLDKFCQSRRTGD